MTSPLQLTWRGLAASPALEARIAREVTVLDGHSRDILGCHAVIAQNQHGSGGANRFSVRLDLFVPGQTLSAERHSGIRTEANAVHGLVRDTFQAVRRQLRDHGQRSRER